jgi:hypothetical protein
MPTSVAHGMPEGAARWLGTSRSPACPHAGAGAGRRLLPAQGSSPVRASACARPRSEGRR